MNKVIQLGVRVPEFYMCVKDTGTKYQLWISDFNIDGTFGSRAGSGGFCSDYVRSEPRAHVGFFTTVKLD